MSLLFEWMEISLRHILPNFWECWWDHILLDVFGCNFLGIIAGLYICKKFGMKRYKWQIGSLGSDLRRRSVDFIAGFCGGSFCPPVRNARQAGCCPRVGARLQRGVIRCLTQFTPAKWTEYYWPSFLSNHQTFLSLLFFSVGVTLLDLNLFFLKAELWIDTSHWIITARTLLWGAAAASGTREFYEFITDRSQDRRMGLQCWLDLAMVSTELLLVIKWFQGLLPHPDMPTWIAVCWVGIAAAVVSTTVWLYFFPRVPTIQERSPSTTTKQS
eukprot:GHVS01055553.1.p1 GENE.GHVS01055553.1~~GHVS01055553.1.p1  ORF type:complete len:271 (+),score=19.64 GHVS01055553.1:307-1119(+)